MASLMIGRHLLLVFGHDHGLTLGAHHYLVFGILKLLHGDQAFAATCGKQRRLIHKVCKVSARKAWGSACDHAPIDVGSQWYLPHVHFEDLNAAINVGARHNNLPIKTAGTQQGWVKDVGPVGGSDDDDAFIGLKAVHFDQQLVQRLFALVILVTKACTAATSNCVDFVYEDNAWRIFLRLFKHVAHAACANANEHFNKVRARD